MFGRDILILLSGGIYDTNPNLNGVVKITDVLTGLSLSLTGAASQLFRVSYFKPSVKKTTVQSVLNAL
jgi:hypothetical protein